MGRKIGTHVRLVCAASVLLARPVSPADLASAAGLAQLSTANANKVCLRAVEYGLMATGDGLFAVVPDWRDRLARHDQRYQRGVARPAPDTAAGVFPRAAPALPRVCSFVFDLGSFL
jgi:hypothetical protein